MLELFAENTVLRLLMLVLLFASVAAMAYLATQAVTVRQAARRRLLGDRQATDGPAFGTLRVDRVESTWLRLVNSIEKSGLSLVDTKDAALRGKLIAAGMTAAYAPRVFTLVRLLLVVGLPLLVLTLFWMSGSSPGIVKLYFSLVIAAGLGLYLPNIYVRARADRRRRDLINGFPDALDLMLVCVEAGLGLEAAFSRVGMEMTTSHPRLAEQFGRLCWSFEQAAAMKMPCVAWQTARQQMRFEPFRPFSFSRPSWGRRLPRRCASMRRRCARDGECAQKKRRIVCPC